jgi:hypothetical protein
MLLTTLFEGYRWSWVAAAGVLLAVIGNLIALGVKPRVPVTERPAAPR